VLNIPLGGNGHDHPLLWHQVRLEKPTVCIECGQFFKLKLMAEDPIPKEFIAEGATKEESHEHGHGSHGAHAHH
jgi:hypothetical protein